MYEMKISSSFLMGRRARRETVRESKTMKAFGVQEWFARARVGEKQSPTGVLSGSVMRKAFVDSYTSHVSVARWETQAQV